MRIVMPLFDFEYKDCQEFVFGDGIYSLREFIAENEIPEIAGLSSLDIEYMKMESWALVAENPNIDKYKVEVNILLLSFKIFKLARLFIKYRLCKENTNFCSRINETMQYVLKEESLKEISLDDLKIINNGFSDLLRMSNILDVKNNLSRCHNTLYFLYRGFFSTQWMDSFIFLMSALEALFSKEEYGETTKTICLRVSKFLDSKQGCAYKDIEKLYNVRSRILHGNIKADYLLDENLKKSQVDKNLKKLQVDKNLKKLQALELIVVECMRKMLDEKIYLIYEDIEKKEKYFSELVGKDF